MLLIFAMSVSAFIYTEQKITEIKVFGNTTVSSEAIKAKLPFAEGDSYRPDKSAQLIRSVLKLGFFNNVTVVKQELSANEIQLYIIVDEKKRVEGFVFVGNDHLTEDEIQKKIVFEDIKALNDEEIQLLSQQIKKLYTEKNYHNAKIYESLEPSVSGTGYNAVFTIQEGCISRVKRVNFIGNKCISSRTLRGLIFTREDWILAPIMKAGIYQPDAIEYDKFVIENAYQSNGFMTAKVIDVQVDMNEQSSDINVTYFIEEGEQYLITDVRATGNDLVTEQQLLNVLLIKPGMLYSKELIRQSMENLRLVWGEHGFVNAEIQPSIVPDHDSKTVTVEFNSDLGKCVTVNRIIIQGNKKTRDNVIRRQILINEGEKLTSFKMDESKRNVERLGYFDPKDGVNWHITRLDEENADLELLLKEVKTGKIFWQVGFGGVDDIQSPADGAKVGFGFQDTNMLGTGIQYNVNGTYSKQDQMVAGTISNPWLFGHPLYGSLDAYHRRSAYDDFPNVQQVPVERLTGGYGIIGHTPVGWNQTQLFVESGAERIRYERRPVAGFLGEYSAFRENFQQTLDDSFIPGTLVWVMFSAAQDKRNHPMFPSRGHQWVISSKVAVPHCKGEFGYVKLDFDYRWYTPLIGEYDLVFYAHTHLGFVSQFHGYNVPYRELYHIGGLSSVRGFLFGQIGPSLVVKTTDPEGVSPTGTRLQTNSIGGKKAFWINTELQFPITKDMSIRGVFFYDGGAGWDNPLAGQINPIILRNNQFTYRHSIGFGLRMTQPTPLQVDWGFKLDRNRRRGEPLSEMHFTALREF